MLFWACAWKCSPGLGWSADVCGVHSIVTGTGCPGVGGTASGKPNPGDDPGGSPGSAPGFASEGCCCPPAPRGGQHAWPCPPLSPLSLGCPLLTIPQGCPVAGAGPVLLSTE